MTARGPKPTVTYDGKTYSVRSTKVEIPDLESMDRMGALIWINQNTYARGYSRPSGPNIAGAFHLVVR